MQENQIQTPPVAIDLNNWMLSGNPVQSSKRYIKDLEGIFHDQIDWKKTDPNQIVYDVQLYFPVEEQTEGGLFFGNTTIFPGKVGNEYFMTKGHFHSIGNRAEYYWTIQGEGMLILMDRERRTWGERMFPGSLHYIGGNIAHRTANTGDSPFVFGACWPSDAGHDYDSIAKHGFSSRLIELDGKPMLVSNK